MQEQRPDAMDLRERVAYLIGATRGQGAEDVVAGILEVLAAMAREVDRLRASERALRSHLAELADEVFAGDTSLLHCERCGQAMRVLTADLHDDQVELVCPGCGHLVHGYDHGLDYDEDEDTLEGRSPDPDA